MADKTVKLIISGEDRASTVLDQIARNAATLNRDVGVLGAGLEEGFAPLATAAKGILALDAALAVMAAGGLAVLSREIVTAGQTMAGLRLSIDAAVGGTEAGEKAFKSIRSIAAQLGIDLESAGNGFKTVAAAAKGSSLEGKGALQIFTGIATAGAGLGLSNEVLEGSFLALGQMISKGKITAEEWNGQLAERLPGATQIASQALGVTTADFFKMMQNGELTLDVLPKIGKALEAAFKDQAGKIDPLLKATANLNTAWFEFTAGLYKDLNVAGAFAPVVDSVKNLFSGIVTEEITASLKNLVARAADYALLMVQAFPEALQRVDFSGLLAAFDSLGGSFGSLFGDLDLTTPEGLAAVLQTIVDGMTTLTGVTEGLFEVLFPMMRIVGDLAVSFSQLDPAVQSGLGFVVGSGAALSLAGGAISSMSGAVSALSSAFTVLAGNPVVIAAIAAGGLGYLLGTAIGDAIYQNDQLTEAVTGVGDAMLASHTATELTDAKLKSLTRTEAEIKTESEKLTAAFLKTADPLGLLGKAAAQTTTDLAATEKKSKDLAKEQEQAARAAETLKLKLLELANEKEIKSMEFAAQINVAQITADVEKVKANFVSLDTIINSSGTLLASLFGNLDSSSGGSRRIIEDMIKQEAETRKTAADDVHRLSEIQIETARRRLDMMRSGGSLITIDGAGLEPELEAFLFKILERIQMRVAGDYGAFLLGL